MWCHEVDVACREVHIYADQRLFFIVPVVRLSYGLWVEGKPVRQVKIASQRKDFSGLARAIQATADYSEQLMGSEDVLRWDGEQGRLWEQNHLFATIEWYPDKIVLSPQKPIHSRENNRPLEWIDDYSDTFSENTSVEDIARWVLVCFRRCGHKLSDGTEE